VFTDNVDSQYASPVTCTNVYEVYICSRSSGDHSTETSGSVQERVHDDLNNEQLFLEKWTAVCLDFTKSNLVVVYPS
jgi:hypothetical protein